ncbi:amidohydrolase [bacterium]|nr:amidohydrolase [bacterium]
MRSSNKTSNAGCKTKLSPIRTAVMVELAQKVNHLVEAITQDVIAWRRDFHAHPELSNREERTAQTIAAILQNIGVDDRQTQIAHHGVVACIKGNHPGPCVALRADFDALPVTEQTDLPFASQNSGVMHACGHDCHTSILLGAAHVLAQLRDRIHGTVKLLFQPCEEGAPAGEKGGAPLMIEQGVLNNPNVETVFALHIDPLLDTGNLSYTPGGHSAAVDIFDITVHGKQSHAAYPWDGVDPIVAAAQIVSAVQTIVSRVLDIRETAVVSICQINGGARWNILPDRVTLTGTIRTHDEQVRAKIHQTLERIIHQTAAAHGASAGINIQYYGPVLHNDRELAARMLPSLQNVVGKQHVHTIPPTMHGEDFAYFAQNLPCLYFNLGVHNQKLGPPTTLHSPNLLVDEAALPIGVKAISMLALDYLNHQNR